MSNIADMWSNKGKKSKPKSKSKSSFVSCWASHPVYKIGKFGIIGGSCTSEYPDVDVFIALDGSGKKGERSYPWNKGVDIYFKIVDMGVPKDLTEFKKLLSYTVKQMKAGKKVFVGCIGGHGRTGLFLAALTKVMTGDKDAITTVRENYCKKAVESSEQINWLHKHFGIKKVEGSKATLSQVWQKGKGKGKTHVTQFGTDLTEDWIQGKVTENKAQNYMSVASKHGCLIVNKDA